MTKKLLVCINNDFCAPPGNAKPQKNGLYIATNTKKCPCGCNQRWYKIEGFSDLDNWDYAGFVEYVKDYKPISPNMVILDTLILLLDTKN